MTNELGLEHPGNPDDAFLLDPSRASEIVELVILTRDDAFMQTLRTAVGESRRLWHVPTADKVSDLLLAGQVGILVLDAQALRESTSAFVSQLKRQFPDLVVLVAAHRDAEVTLAALVSDGSIYRLIHKPLSPGRAQSFTDAAVKKFSEQRRPKPAVASMRPHAPYWALWSAGGLVMVSIVLFVVRVLLIAHGSAQPRSAVPTSPLPIRTPQAQSNASLLDRADTALSVNRLMPPAADNALDLYSSALAQDPSDGAARAGLAEVHERLLARAENALLEERFGEAAAAIELARRGGVENGRIAFLTSELKKARDLQRTTAAARPESHTALRPAADQPVYTDGNTVSAAPPPAPAPAPTAAPQSLAALESPALANQPALAHQAPAVAASAAAAPNGDAAQIEAPDIRAEVVAAARLSTVKTVSPVYPRKAELSATAGWVALEFTVTETGTVKDIVVADAKPRGVFDDAAVAALSQWIYQPVLRNGKPAPQRARIRLRFELRD